MRRAFLALSVLVTAGLGSDGGALTRRVAGQAEVAPKIHDDVRGTRAAPPAPAVVDVSPTGDRVEPTTPIVVRFDADVADSMRETLLTLEPPLAVTRRWLDPRTVELRPRSWRLGRVQRVRVGVPGGDVTEWSFRARVPPPEGIVPGAGARLVLTFDDGPNDRRQADRLLDLLRELSIRALFFPSGRWTSKRPDWVARAREEGHRVCNHTRNHVNLTAPWMTEARIREEIEGGATDGDCKLFRPPLMGYDARVERVAAQLGYELYLWDIDSRDWEGAPADDVTNAVLRGARPDAVVLFHIHANSTFSALPPLAQQLRAAGYVLSWDPADAARDPEQDGVGPSGTAPRRREWAAELDRPTSTGDGLDGYEPVP